MVWKIESLRRIWYAIPFLAVSIIGFVSLAGLLYDRVYQYDDLQRGILASLVVGAAPAIQKFGLAFLWTTEWDPVQEKFGGLVMIYGTLATSIIALLIAVPVSFGIALFLTELSPAWLKRPLGTAIELLAAVPSIVYGMWGLLVFGPILATFVQKPLQALFGGVPVLGANLPRAAMRAAMANALVGDERAGDEPTIATQLSGELEHRAAGGGIDRLHVAGVHVDGRSESGCQGAFDVALEAEPVHLTARRERQEDRRHPGDAAVGPEAIDQVAGRRVGRLRHVALPGLRWRWRLPGRCAPDRSEPAGRGRASRPRQGPQA